MRGLSVFSGIGGLDLAAEWAGIEPVAFSEIDPFCQSILKKHWPDVPIFNDIFNLRGDDIGPVDIIYGGFPCQPFSVAGKQKGKADKRHLWPEVARLVGEIKPRWCFFENVPGILKLAADDVCTDLERLGYSVGIWNFEAAAVGANHRRARVAFVAHSGRALRPGSDKQGVRGTENRRGEASEHQHTSGVPGFVSDSETIYVQGQRDGQGQGEFEGSSRRSAEPRLGRGFDGISKTLDKIGGLTDGAKERAREILSNMWDSALSEKIWSNFRRFHGVHEEEILLAFLCEYEENSDYFCSTQKSGCLSGETLRNLWREVEAARASHRRKYRKQYAREYSNALHSLSQHLPSLMSQAWRSGCWEDDIPRVARGVKDRVNRLKALGNAVVPAWAYPIFKSIMEADQYA